MIKFAAIARRAFQLVLAAVIVFQPLSAQDPTKASILQNSADQQDIRQHTTILVTQIQSMIDELAANGITGDDLKVLQTTKAVLSNLSSKEMARVVASLQKAGADPGTENGRESAFDAYAGQKGIILEFHQILKDYEQRQAALELPARFKELTDRQTDTMWTTAQVATTAAGKSISEMTTMQQTTAQIVATDQDSLTSDVALAQQQLDKAAEGSTGDEGSAMQQAQKDIKTGALQKALDAAAADLKAGHLLQATTEQKVARDQLRQISKDLNPATDAVAALSQTAADLAKVIDGQKSLLGETSTAENVRPRPTGLDQKQGMLVDKTNSLQDDMKSMSPDASALVKEAMNPMQLSRAALSGSSALAKSATNQADALAKLEQAQAQVAQQLAEAQKAADDAAKDPVAKLQDLQKQIQTALQQQQQLTAQTAQTSNPPAPDQQQRSQQQQSQLQTQTAALQQTAQPLSLPASQALANAANQMAQAQQDLGDPSTAAHAPADQQAAQTALAQASQVVTQQIASAQAAAADPAALASAASSLDKAQSDVSNAIADSAPPSHAPTASAPSSMPAAATALAQAAEASAAAAATPGLPAAAAEAVQAAQAAIGKGQKAAAQGNAPATSEAAASAQTSLAQARAAVALAQAGLPAPGAPMAGGPPDAKVPGMVPAPPEPDAPSKDGAKMVSGGSTDKGALHDVSGAGAFLTVATRDRSAVGQTQSEKRPQEYAPMIDQYLKNLADQSSSSSP